MSIKLSQFSSLNMPLFYFQSWKNNFTEYGILDWQLFFFSTLKKSFQYFWLPFLLLVDFFFFFYWQLLRALLSRQCFRVYYNVSRIFKKRVLLGSCWAFLNQKIYPSPIFESCQSSSFWFLPPMPFSLFSWNFEFSYAESVLFSPNLPGSWLNLDWYTIATLH